MSYSRTLHFYILGETLKVFVLSVAAVTLVMNFGAVLIYLNRFPLPLPSLMKVLVYRLPALFPWTFPLSLLVAVTLTYGRMSTDNEIMAMRASGMHMGWVMLPGLVLGAAVSMGLFAVNDRVQPYCELREYQVVNEEAPKVLPMMLTSPDRYREYLANMPYKVAGERLEGNRLYGVEVTKYDANQGVVEQYQGEWADFTVEEVKDAETGKLSRDLVLKLHNAGGMNYPKTTIRFEELMKRIPLSGMFHSGPGNRSLTTGELRKKLVELRAKIGRDEEKLKSVEAGGKKEAEIRHWRYELQQDKEDENGVLTRIYSRPSLSAAALAFVMVGVPLGVVSRRSHMLSAFFLASLPVLVAYYPLWLVGQAVAENLGTNTVTIAAAVWAPTLVMAAGGTGLMVYLTRR